MGWKKNYKLCLELLCRDSMRNLIIPLRRQFFVENDTKYRIPYADPSCYMSFASDAYCLVTSVMFPNYEDVN